jgi:hypothetical protein
MRVSSEDSKTAAQLMIIIHSERSRGCTEKPTPDDRFKLKEWLRIAYEPSHNKAFKFVPVLRASTGRVLRTRRLTKTLCELATSLQYNYNVVYKESSF